MTGASGFLGRRVVEALVSRGHEVRALVRPASGWSRDGVEVFRGDLRAPGAATEALAGVDCVVHLAAQVTGSDEARFAGTVVATENLLVSMRSAGVARMVLASSFSVYDWSAVWRDEATPLEEEPGIYERDGYAVAKWWQERIVRREPGLSLTVLRPGFIWSADDTAPDAVGLGPFVIGPLRRLPLTHVERCAERFADAVEEAGGTHNVVDPDPPTAWRHAGGRGIPVPYALAFAAVRSVYALARVVLGPRLRLPSAFVPRRFEARFKPIRVRP